MSGLPKGWVEATLEELCQFNPKHDPDVDQSLGVNFVPMPAVDDETGAIIDKSVVRPLSEIWKGYTHFADRDVIFAKITPCMENGKIAVARDLANGMACGSTEFHVLRSKGAVEPDFLWRFLRRKNYRQVAEHSMTGAVGQRRVPRQFLETTSLPLPPLNEQKRIVAKLDTLNAKSARARTELARIEILVSRFKQAVLSKAFSGELTKDWRSGQTTLAPWENLPLSQLVSHGPSNGWSPKADGKVSGLKSLKLSATSSGRLRLDESTIKYLDQTLPEDSKFWLLSDDIVIQRANSLELLGTTVLFDGPPGEFIFPDLMMRIRVNDKKTNPRYLATYLNSDSARSYFRANATGSAGNMPKINGSTVRETRVPTPPLEEQQEIVHRIESAFAMTDRLAAEAMRALDLVGKLGEAILAKAFRGELVPQDENDEPAEKLLERIRAEREAAPEAKRGRRKTA
ncbi:type I restriction endonuclease subunit S [Rhizobium leguminosarum]|uniref:Type I restriction enzyme specificity subunit n=1 Tax=Rhizobium johnstonii (strain DSM 114642 / LMG 32736 / 3841) TaxID=216596 RepID=Q1MKB2_RHIJ3|nr:MULTISPECIES: restriction endonuclease subunit S [Rhizobium]NEI96112.1 type I restriction endonuclease subunit S [Rhizobium leguminosarum]NEJ79092.1 type I restriction endonuclease subunit S [Rhizobium leguminosarum]TBF39250.1 type I restriction endonuclease subunit S [Rhizobium leguminosarum]TBF50951.1 type I restriction endonuclease subunit S [Rhizobium leguminosarum]TBF55624.1 type I restriction endonuclease subunit S [Rhizobium leguminosarum]